MRPVVKKLRGQATPAERALWRLLRGRQLAGVKFRRQHEFGPYVLDFFCPDQRLVVEVDGGQHFMSKQQARDAARTAFLGEHGLRVLRFGNNQVMSEPESVLEAILLALETPSPLPSPRGRGNV